MTKSKKIAVMAATVLAAASLTASAFALSPAKENEGALASAAEPAPVRMALLQADNDTGDSTGITGTILTDGVVSASQSSAATEEMMDPAPQNDMAVESTREIQPAADKIAGVCDGTGPAHNNGACDETCGFVTGGASGGPNPGCDHNNGVCDGTCGGFGPGIENCDGTGAGHGTCDGSGMGQGHGSGSHKGTGSGAGGRHGRGGHDRR